MGGQILQFSRSLLFGCRIMSENKSFHLILLSGVFWEDFRITSFFFISVYIDLGSAFWL